MHVVREIDATPHAGAANFARYVVPELGFLDHVTRALTRSPHDAEDLRQEVLIRAYRASARFDGRFPKAWLATIARNTAAHLARHRKDVVLAGSDVAELAAPVADPDAQPEATVLRATFDADIERAMANLPAINRAVIELVDIDGRSYQEAAARLNIPIGTVMSRLHRARRMLRRALPHRSPSTAEPIALAA